MKKIGILLCLLASFSIFAEKGTRVFHKPHDLITPMRFDVMAKYIFAKHYTMGVQSDWALRLYDEHIHVWNNRRESCPPNIFHYYCAKEYVAKNGIESYVNTFQKVIDSIRENGLDPEKSVVPIGNDKSLIDGAHRVAACILFNKTIACELFSSRGGYDGTAKMLQNKRDFVRSGLSQKFLDDMALSYATLKSSAFIITVFPSAVGKQAEIENILRSYGKIVYQKSISVEGTTGSVNFLRVLYDGEPFIGSFKNDFHGARLKAPYCYPANRPGPTRVFLFEFNNPAQVRTCKSQLRALFNIGHDSVHINDTHPETIRIAQTVFNNNSIHFINHASRTFCPTFEKLIEHTKNWMKQYNIDSECFCVDSSAILSAYGLRDCRDLDLLHHGYTQELKTVGTPFVGSHNEELKYHAKGLDDIIFNPENFFYCRGIKFASLQILKAMKSKRNEPKDRVDVQLINKAL